MLSVSLSYCDTDDAVLSELGGCPAGVDREKLFASLLLKGRQSLSSDLFGDEPLFFVRLREVLRGTTNREDRLKLSTVLDELGQGDLLRWAFNEGARSLQRTAWPKSKEGAVYRSVWGPIQDEFYASWARHSLYAAGESARHVKCMRASTCIIVIEEAINRDVGYAAKLCRLLDDSDRSRRTIGRVLHRLRVADGNALRSFVVDFRGRVDPWSTLTEPPWRLAAGELYAQEEAEGDVQHSWYGEFERRVGSSAAATIKRDAWIGRGRVKPLETLRSLIESRSYGYSGTVMNEWVERDAEKAFEFVWTLRDKIPERFYLSYSLKALEVLALGDPEGAVRKADALIASMDGDAKLRAALLATMDGGEAELRAMIAGARDRVLECAVRGTCRSSPVRAMELHAKVSEEWKRNELAFVVMSIWGAKDLNAAFRFAESLQGQLKDNAVAGVLVSAVVMPFPDRMRSVLALNDGECRVRAIHGLFARADVQESMWSSVLSLSGDCDEWTAAICGLAQSLHRKRNETLRAGYPVKSEVGRSLSPVLE
jgi:hypothetical protein